MSLLMQALRTAEKAKKEQAAAASLDAAASTPNAPQPPQAPEGLSLQPQEPTVQAQAEAEAEAEAAKAMDQGESAGAAVASNEHATDPARAPVVDYFGGDASPPVPSYRPETVALNQPAPAPPPRPLDTPAPAPVPTADAAAHRPAALNTGLAADTAGQAAKVQEQARTAAAAVFAAKQRSARRRPLLLAAAGVLVLGLGAAYGYMEWSRVANPPALAIVVPAPAQPGAPAALTAPPEAEPVPVPAAVVPAQTALAPAAPAPGTPAQVASDRLAPRPAPPVGRSGQAQDVAPRAAVRAGPVRSAAVSDTAEGEPIAIRRSDSTRQLAPGLSLAYQAYGRGDLPGAQSAYQQVLRQEPNNRDALLGMAAVALARGQGAQAGSFYSRLLELDPADADAQTGLAGLERGDPAITESRLKKILAEHPHAGPALFALGNVYAQQGRWAEAQQAYFRAVGAAPANPDYLFNLAVSLDKLDQPRLALDYYQRALLLARDGGARLDDAAVRARIAQLQANGGGT